MDTTPLVTVVIPTYNWATVLPYSIASVLGQTMGDLELLIVGDGCTDESEDVVRGIGDARVQWINLALNCGSQAGPNNEALRCARGTYMAYLGHDDLWLPKHLEHLVDGARSGTAMAHGLQLRVEPERAPYIAPPASWTYKPGSWVPPTSLLHRVDHARAIGGWRFAKDTAHLDPESDLCARLARAYGAPRRVDHVTSIKFPAARRRNVYRLRPCHEQERWSRRIREAEDPEHMVRLATGDPIDESLGALPDELRGQQPISAMERYLMRRRIKGLDT
jgi:glycosyltransferase involved in cell wall biosynthesis